MKKNIFLFFICTTVISAQQSLDSLSLSQAIEFAKIYSRIVQKSEIDQKIAKSVKMESTSLGLPNINFNANYNYNIQLPTQLVPSNFSGQSGASLPEYRPIQFGLKESILVKVELKQMLFDASYYFVSAKSSRNYLNGVRLGKEKVLMEVENATINAYLTTILAKENLRIAKENFNISENDVRESKIRVENGLEDSLKLRQLKINRNSLRSNYERAMQIEGLSYKMLNMILGVDIEQRYLLTDNIEKILLLDFDRQASKDKFLVQKNIDYNIASNKLKAKHLILKNEKYQRYPKLNAFLSAGYSGYSNNTTFFRSDQDWYGQSLAGLSLSFPIFNGFGIFQKVKQAKLEFSKASIDLKETEEKLKIDFQKLKVNYQYAVNSFNTSKDNLILSRSIERETRIKFEAGFTSAFEMQQAQLQLYKSQTNYLNAIQNMVAQKASLDKMLKKIN